MENIPGSGALVKSWHYSFIHSLTHSLIHSVYSTLSGRDYSMGWGDIDFKKETKQNKTKECKLSGRIRFKGGMKIIQSWFLACQVCQLVGSWKSSTGALERGQIFR